jgi:retron-type reverse transcriptase
MITKSILLKHETQITKQIITLLETILQQNYFSFENNLYQPEKGISMGSPISNTIAEIFLQLLENTYLKQLLDTKSIIFYRRYVDDILMIYDIQCINSNIIHEYINQIHPNLQLNPIHKNDNSINFLPLLIIRNPPPPPLPQPGNRYIP